MRWPLTWFCLWRVVIDKGGKARNRCPLQCRFGYLVDTTSSLSIIFASWNSTQPREWYARAGDLILARQTLSESSYYHPDGLGSIRVWTDSSGPLVGTQSFTAFGERSQPVSEGPV